MIINIIASILFMWSGVIIDIEKFITVNNEVWNVDTITCKYVYYSDLIVSASFHLLQFIQNSVTIAIFSSNQTVPLVRNACKKCNVCTSRFCQFRRTPWLTARVQWIHVHSLRINGDLSFTIVSHHQNNAHPTPPKGACRTPGSLLLWWRKPKYLERTTCGNRQTREISEDWSPGQIRGQL